MLVPLLNTMFWETMRIRILLWNSVSCTWSRRWGVLSGRAAETLNLGSLPSKTAFWACLASSPIDWAADKFDFEFVETFSCSEPALKNASLSSGLSVIPKPANNVNWADFYFFRRWAASMYPYCFEEILCLRRLAAPMYPWVETGLSLS